MLKHTSMFMDCLRKQTYQCAQYKLEIVYKTRQQKTQVSIFFLRNIFWFPCYSAREDLSTDVSITTV